jgi:two-component system KDP operon response regulator KdpE
MEQARAPSILVIDDEPQIRRAVRNAVAALAERVLEADTGSTGIDAAAAEHPSLVILDLGLPDMDGVSVCRELRKWSRAPILVLSARHSEGEKVKLLDAGADDFITKPFSTRELQARVRAHLRRDQMGEAERSPLLRIGELEIDAARRTVRRAGQNVHLTPTEWDLLRVFVNQRDRTLTHQQLFNAVWPRSGGDPQQYLRVYVANLRRKIEIDPVRPGILITEPGVGYRFQTE